MKFFENSEWNRVRKIRGLPLLLVGIMLIPSLYAVIFLSSLWDTYGKVDQLPVAIVNQDQSAQVNGKNQNLGNDLTKKLLDSKQLKLTKTSTQSAKKGLESGKYYMTITIPKSFTTDSGTLLSANPTQPEIKIAHNTGQGFIAEKLTASAADKIQANVSKSLQRVYNKTLLNATSSAKEGFQSGSDGATKLGSGLSQLQEGTKKLQEGTTQLQTGTSQLATGLTQYTNGVASANNGAQQLTAGVEQLATQLQKISDEINSQQSAKAADLKQLDAGLTQLTQGLQKLSKIESPTVNVDATKLNESSEQLTAGLTGAGKDAASFKSLAEDADFQKFLATNPTVAAKYQAALTDLGANVQSSASAAGTIKNQLTSLQTLLPQLQALQAEIPELQKLGQQGSVATQGAQTAIKTLNSSLTTVSQGIANQAVPGAQQLAQGASQLTTGLGQLTSKNATLNSGTAQLRSGTDQLLTGESQASEALQQAGSGATTLSNKLADGAIKLSAVHHTQANVTALSQPTKKHSSNLSVVPNNGTGMAPYMMSVGLFVGMITLSTIFDFTTVLKKPKNGFTWWANKQLINVPIFIGQALIMTGLLFLVDGMQAQRPAMTVVVALAAAFGFNQFVILFNVLIGKLGSGIMLVLMILQLSASAGSYPIELSNGFFEAIHPWMPMSYSVHAFRETISIGGSVASDLAVLIGLGVISMVLTWGVYQMKLKHNQLTFKN
ncbi:membrane protein [Leuconostoc litchii]|uniref:YhgE/Pip domain-containing protein n=1 Tax=Leuconostoc litchii TaxID=1981069 RepID=A0A6P2CMY4_9LACO|nr:YhgE/Pip domain-containing protein [Leuconostoc litchii]TYC46315.1 YhgE/Pip domain-containing protein [Leuconostoc litchii]GMA70036.1 membrane protein [Leuconostoc litchii]